MAVTAEYRRFLVLTQLAGHAVSPAPDVDEAWHLHLTRTAHYERFCLAVFGRFLHHEPSRGGHAEDARHRDMYEATLAAYRAAFADSAPAAIWPRPGRPRAAAPAVGPSWRVPEALHGGRRMVVAMVMVAGLAGLVLEPTRLLHPLQAIPPGAFLLVTLLVTLGLGWYGLRPAAGGARDPARDVLEPYEAAWFSGGAPRMAMTAVAALVERGVLRHVPAPADPRAPRPPLAVNRSVAWLPAHPAEQAVMSAATDEGLRFGEAVAALQSLAGQNERRLRAAGLANEAAALPLPRARALAGLALWLVVAFERIVHGLLGTHPVGFLILLTLVDVALMMALARQPGRASPRAEESLKGLRLRAGAYKKTAPVGPALALGVALMGTAAFAGDERFAGLDGQLGLLGPDGRALGRRAGGGDGGSSCSSCGSGGSWGSSSDGSGSSCGSGGSSCGSSCGGGGGCGGGGD